MEKNIPSIFKSDIFKVIEHDADKIKVKCQLCPGTSGVLNGSTKSTTNFLTHVRRKHPNQVNAINDIIVMKKCSKRTANTSIVVEEESPRKISKNEAYSNPFSIASVNATRNALSVEKCNEALLNYIIKEMRPLSSVDKPAFRELVEVISNGRFKPVCRQTMSKQISNRMELCKSDIKKIMANQDYICTTADIWSKNNKSFFGVTAHIIDSVTLKRKSFVFACRRIKFSHNYSLIAQILHEVHSSYIQNTEKIVGTVTDNAKNFCKAFKIFSNDENTSCQLENQDKNVEVTDLDFSQLLISDDEFDRFCLPPQYKCCSHTLSLIATTDIQKSVSTSNIKKIYHSVFGKLSTIWNAISRSTKASDEVEKICKKKLRVPCATRWNSMFDSVLSILEIKDQLDVICEALDKPKFKSIELDFLSEYIQVLRPLALAIDILQGEDQMYLGYVLPTLLQILHTQSNFVNLKFCSVLSNTIIEGVKSRFNYILDYNNVLSRPFIYATVSLPIFKLNWIDKKKDTDKHQYIKDLFSEEVQKQFHNSVDDKNSPLVQKVSFFDFMNKVQTVDNNNSALIELLEYLESPQNDILMLKRYPTILKLFKMYNVILPSSAPVERMFSTGGQILTPSRNKLCDDTFEAFVFLKHNM